MTITGNVNLTQGAYLLSAIVNGFGSQTVGPGVSQVGTQYYNTYYTCMKHSVVYQMM